MADDERKVCGACEMPIADGASWISHGAAGPPYHRHTSGCIDALRTTLARLTADLATQTKRWLDAERADSDKAHRLAALGGELFAARLAVETLTAERDEARGLLREAKNALRDCGELVAFVGCTRTDDNETPTDLDAFPCSADDSPVRSKPDEWCEACEASDSIAQVIHGHSVRGPAHLGAK